MPIFDIFKKKEKAKKEKRKERKEKPQAPQATEIKKKPPTAEAPKKRDSRGPVIIDSLALKSPHISEKATRQEEENQYIFKVSSGTGKQEIKKAIEEIYKVKVIKVKIIKIPRRKRRLGRTLGWKKGYKKAIVKIKEGQKIEVLPR